MLLDISFLDDATRPKVPPLKDVKPEQRAAGEHLKEVHDHIRHELDTVRKLMERAAAGGVSEADVASETAGLSMVANFRRFGNLCGQYCALVNTHHSIEDSYLLPAIARISDGYRQVAERLQAEHVVVHELLEREIEALNALARDPGADTFATARTLFEALEQVLLSHLGYEEEQIGDALGYYNVM